MDQPEAPPNFFAAFRPADLTGIEDTVWESVAIGASVAAVALDPQKEDGRTEAARDALAREQVAQAMAPYIAKLVRHPHVVGLLTTALTSEAMRGARDLLADTYNRKPDTMIKPVPIQ